MNNACKLTVMILIFSVIFGCSENGSFEHDYKTLTEYATNNSKLMVVNVQQIGANQANLTLAREDGITSKEFIIIDTSNLEFSRLQDIYYLVVNLSGESYRYVCDQESKKCAGEFGQRKLASLP